MIEPKNVAQRTTPASVWSDPRHFFAFGLGVGALPVAPGTFGTLLAVPLYLLVRDLPLHVYLLHTALLAALGFWLCHVTARDMGVDDHQGIVWDEMVGYLITMTAAPPGWFWIVLGFAWFRLFDIWKPWPIRTIDRRVKGGLGIMLDDIVAGAAACLAVQTCAWLLGKT
ncbi:MAG: phosphatidylglycerophosphatase A [Gammaproteobacteria bacterium]